MQRRVGRSLTCGDIEGISEKRKRPGETGLVGWGGRIRTSEWRNQNPLPYHLATPQSGLRRGWPTARRNITARPPGINDNPAIGLDFALYNNVYAGRSRPPAGRKRGPMPDSIEVSDEAGIRIIRMNRPEKKNALTQPMYAAMTRALADAQDDDAIRCLVIAGGPAAFCAGADIAEFLEFGAERRAAA